MATHSSIPAWRVPWTEEPGGLHTVHRVTNSWTQLKGLSTHYISGCLLGSNADTTEVNITD